MLCEDIMKTEVECVSPVDTIEDAARKMRDDNVGFLPVCDEGRQVLGTITDRDIAIRAVAEGRPLETPVATLMSIDVIACRPEDPLSEAEQLMAQHHKSRIMVVDAGGKLCGVISLSDLAERDSRRATLTMREIASREARL